MIGEVTFRSSRGYLISRFLKEHVESLAVEPSWYLDRKLAIFPILADNHVGHNLQKMGGLVANIDSAFPRTAGTGDNEKEDLAPAHHGTRTPTTPPGLVHDTARDDVTTMFVNIQHLGFSFASNPFTTLATTTHFNTFADHSATGPPHGVPHAYDGHDMWKKGTAVGRETNPAAAAKIQSLLNQNPICFKEAVVYQSCYMPDCLQPNGHDRGAWPLLGFRQPRTQQKVAARFRACAGVEKARERPARNAIVMLYAYRSTWKRFFNQVVLLGQLWEWLREASPSGRIYQSEMDGTPLPKLVAIYSSTDVIVCPYGSGSLLGFLMPPGSAAIEIYRSNAPPLVQFDGDLASDYGSLWRAAYGHRLHLDLQPFNGRVPGNQFAVSHRLLKRTVSAFYCFFDHDSRAMAEGASRLPDLNDTIRADLFKRQQHECVFPMTAMESDDAAMYADEGGEELRRSIRLHLDTALLLATTTSPRQRSSARLLSVYKDSAELAPKLKFLRSQEAASGSHHNLLLVFHCPTRWVGYLNSGRMAKKLLLNQQAAHQALIAAEVAVWRLHVTRHVTILLMLDSADDACPGIDLSSIAKRYQGLMVRAIFKGLEADEGPVRVLSGSYLNVPIPFSYALVSNASLQGSAGEKLSKWMSEGSALGATPGHECNATGLDSKCVHVLPS